MHHKSVMVNLLGSAYWGLILADRRVHGKLHFEFKAFNIPYSSLHQSLVCGLKTCLYCSDNLTTQICTLNVCFLISVSQKPKNSTSTLSISGQFSLVFTQQCKVTKECIKWAFKKVATFFCCLSKQTNGSLVFIKMLKLSSTMCNRFKHKHCPNRQFICENKRILCLE